MPENININLAPSRIDMDLSLPPVNIDLGAAGITINQTNALTFEYPINVPSTLWVINHNLNRYPSVTIIDSSGNEMFGSITHISKNIMHAEFSAAFSGIAYLI